jgi:hypothetical protein
VQRKKDRRPGHQTRATRRVSKIVFYMLLLGIVCWAVAIYSFSIAVRLGLSEQASTRLPIYGIFLGLALGLAIGLVRSIKDIFKSLAAMLVLGAVFWFIGVVVEAVLVAFGLSPEIASWISRVTFGIGVLLGSVTLFAAGQDIVNRFFTAASGRRKPV